MKNILLLLFGIILLSGNIPAQNDTMYVMKAGNVINKQSVKVEDVDSIVFYNPASIKVPINSNYYFYIGTYTDGGSKGIYRSTFQSESGEISAPELVATISNPSFQCISKDHKLLFSVGESTGSVTGFLIDTVTGTLQKTATFSSLGSAPCFVNYDDKTMNVLTANYSSGNVTKIPVTSTGMANGESETHQHTGKSINASRQEGPHAHCSKVDPTGKYIYSCDLGTDKIYVYTIDGESLTLYKTIDIEPGSGPRHIDFHPQLKSMVVVSELAGTVTTFLPDENGCFSDYLSTISTMPDGYTGQNGCADIHFTPDGKYLYASNRGNNSIVIYQIDQSTLEPIIIGWQKNGIKTPRNFAIDPTGNYLLAANQDGNNIVVFKINHENGGLTDTGYRTTLSKPVCITFLLSGIK
jgi:6-phosphogluconolactonase